MKLELIKPINALNKAYLKEKISRNNIERFKENLVTLFNKAQPGISEDTLKDYITEFLRNTWYNPDHAITINKERKDLTIHIGKTAKDPVAVIAEIKKTDSTEMITLEKPNVKALHELVLYYLHERVTIGNNQVKYLLATDVNNWILIDANEFDKKIYRNTKIRKLYDLFVNDKKDNPFFYDELKKIIAETDDTITATFFNFNDYKKIIANADKADDKKLIALYKILSSVHLIKLSFANDSNSLDKNFYAELLHIIGLEEVKDGSKKLIQRKKVSSEASLLENAIIKLKDKDCLRDLTDVTSFGLTADEQLYNIALELCITWINRILFLKLLEAQLFAYHQGTDKGCLFLNDTFIQDFDELNNLFLQVLAEKPAARRERLQAKFSKVPYLNSSLFERTELERKTIDISALDNNIPLPLLSSTVLKDDKGKRKQGELTTIPYLFAFLDSYDFTSEGNAEIQEQNKALINASVLGLIFEKINGYKDGSFFTPGFITMYMCRETLRMAVVQKFNEANSWSCQNFEDLQSILEFQDKEKRQAANNIINSLTICDPAVGSGHFLVSALNELISIKQDLKILQYRHNSQRIKEYSLEIVNDELIIQDIETEDLFEYTLNQKGNIKPELQYLQETLFHEKENLIENCLFGVDINANSVKICRLRLWIELLKNAYYTKESDYHELETLPNIDINIKQGNSLISRFELDADLSSTLKKSKWNIDGYKIAVQAYRSAQNKEEKRKMEDLIGTIKKDFRTDVSTYDPINKKLSKLRGELALLERTDLFSPDTKKKNKANKELENLSTAITTLEKEKDDIQSSAVFKDAFEWRFEFPEVLDSDGKFAGFDVIIGNPPYKMVQPGNTSISELDFFKQRYPFADFKIDLFHLFFQAGNSLIQKNGLLCFIAPSTLLYNYYTDKLRLWLADRFEINKIVVAKEKVFDDADVHTAIYLFTNKHGAKENNEVLITSDLAGVLSNLDVYKTIKQKELSETPGNVWNLLINSSNVELIKKITKHPLLQEIAQINRGLITGDRDKYFSKINISEKYVPILTGSDIGKYYYNTPTEYVLFEKPKTAGGCWDKEVHLAEHKLCIRQIGFAPTATFIDKPYAVTGNIFTVIAENNDLEKFILAIINSACIKYYWQIMFNDFKSSFPQVSIFNLSQIPIPFVDSSSQLPFITLVDKILSAKKADPQTDTSQWENEIDKTVYELYGLTEEEIRIVEGK